ncbi:MAG TPA: ACP S-malonyltransferase [Anaerolineales bacterium]|nr:ACP S-malonyltransferase [Anaerolineales bacterium]
MTTDLARIAFVFPGQGSQQLGMGSELAQAEKAAARVFEEADDLLGFRLSEICWHGPLEALNETAVTQPALLTHSVAVLHALRARRPDLHPHFSAGHSVGELSALVAAGALTLAEGMRLVRERGLAMKEAGEERPGGMAAVLGLDASEVEQACQEITRESRFSVWLANDNCPGQLVVSGEEQALPLVTERLHAKGARKVVRLAVSIAAHSPLMRSAQERFNRALEQAVILDPQTPVVGNVEATLLQTASEVRADLSAQLTRRVRWTESVQAMIRAGVMTCIELGPGNVLSGLIRRIDRSVQTIAIDAPASFAELAG